MIIKIKNYNTKAFLGIYPQEQILPINISINIELKLKNQQVLKTKNIAHSIDYATITAKIDTLIAKNKFLLIEDLASDVVNICKAEENLDYCKVEVNKIGVFSHVEAFAVELEYKNQ